MAHLKRLPIVVAISVVALLSAVATFASASPVPAPTTFVSPIVPPAQQVQATKSMTWFSYLSFVARNAGPVGSGWVHFGPYNAPANFEWGMGVEPGVKYCAGGIPPIAGFWYPFAVYKLNGTWIVFQQGEIFRKAVLQAWRCEDGKLVNLGVETETGGGLFSRYGEDWLIWSRKDFPPGGSSSKLARVVADGNGVKLVDIREITPAKIDDVRWPYYAAYEYGFIGPTTWLTHYEMGVVSPTHKVWEHTDISSWGGDLGIQRYDGGRTQMAVSPSGRWLYMNWVNESLFGGDPESWSCGVFDIHNENWHRIYGSVNGTNPCMSDSSWVLADDGEELWLQNFMQPLLTIWSAKSQTFRRIEGPTGWMMSMSQDGERMYLPQRNENEVTIWDTGNLSRTWKINFVAVPSPVLPTR